MHAHTQQGAGTHIVRKSTPADKQIKLPLAWAAG